MKQAVIGVTCEFFEWFKANAVAHGGQGVTSGFIPVTGLEFGDAMLIFMEFIRKLERLDLLADECNNVTSNRKTRKAARHNTRISRQQNSPDTARKRKRFKVVTTPEFRNWFDSVKIEMEGFGVPSMTDEEFADALMALIEQHRHADGFDDFASLCEGIVKNRIERWHRNRNLRVEDVRSALNDPPR